MKVITFIMLALLTSAVAADPTVTNQDADWYELEFNCKHISAGQGIGPDQTITFDQFQSGMRCEANIYPHDNPYGKDGNYDKKKLISSAKLKKGTECVVRKHRLVCQCTSLKDC